MGRGGEGGKERRKEKGKRKRKGEQKGTTGSTFRHDIIGEFLYMALELPEIGPCPTVFNCSLGLCNSSMAPCSVVAHKERKSGRILLQLQMRVVSYCPASQMSRFFPPNLC